MKYRISTRTSFVTISLLILLILTMCAVFANCNLNSIANASYNQSQKECILSIPNIEDDYDDSSIIVCMDNVVGGINKIYDASFFGEFAKEVNDLTYITGDIDDKEYLDKENFTQILQITLKAPSKQNVINAINFMKNVPGVLSASPNLIITAEPCSLYPTYPLEGANYRDLWGLHGEYGIDVENAWYMSDGNESIRVAVIDGGIAEHEDLTPNLVEGWDFVNNNNITNDDVFGHGTHVAGIIGAWGTTEDTGVVGVCPNVQLVPLQVYDNSTSTSPKYIYEAITWSINNNIDIINLSSEDPSEYIEMRSAIGNFKGLFVCAAGNYGKDNDITKTYPAYYAEGLSFSDRVISVGAIDKDGNRGVWSDVKSSNYGKNSVSIFAPGTQILSTVPTSVSASGYGYDSGTSMAAPHVTGVAALLYAVYMNVEPSLTRSQIAAKIKTTIINSATYTSQMSEMCRARGILNATNALSSVMFNISYASDGINITGLKQQFNNYKVTIPPMIKGRPVVRIAIYAIM